MFAAVRLIFVVISVRRSLQGTLPADGGAGPVRGRAAVGVSALCRPQTSCPGSGAPPADGGQAAQTSSHPSRLRHSNPGPRPPSRQDAEERQAQLRCQQWSGQTQRPGGRNEWSQLCPGPSFLPRCPHTRPSLLPRQSNPAPPEQPRPQDEGQSGEDYPRPRYNLLLFWYFRSNRIRAWLFI